MSEETVYQAGQRAIVLCEGDITRECVDAIVNAANAHLGGGGGVDGAIHRAGGPAIGAECHAIRSGRGPLKPGEAVATAAGKLSARRVIHTAGPVYQNGCHGEETHLRACVRNSLELAATLGAHSVALPAISTGAYGYPFTDAIRVILEEMRLFLESDAAPSPMTLRLLIFGGDLWVRARRIAEQVFGQPN
ncbi:macro domain-containing protein [Candidatus Poribacteria bacterium]|nr:macro domain-containing protein [Candidatus Poribacteria bacterium]